MLSPGQSKKLPAKYVCISKNIQKNNLLKELKRFFNLFRWIKPKIATECCFMLEWQITVLSFLVIKESTTGLKAIFGIKPKIWSLLILKTNNTNKGWLKEC